MSTESLSQASGSSSTGDSSSSDADSDPAEERMRVKASPKKRVESPAKARSPQKKVEKREEGAEEGEGFLFSHFLFFFQV